MSDRLRISNTSRHHSFDISGALACQKVRDLRTLFPDLYVNQDYRAHLPYTSLRINFGRRE